MSRLNPKNMNSGDCLNNLVNFGDSNYQPLKEVLKSLEGLEPLAAPPSVDPKVVLPIAEIPAASGKFCLSQDHSYYYFRNVLYNKNLCDFAWQKNLLDQGVSKTFWGWINSTINTAERLPNTRHFYSCFRQLYHSETNIAKDLLDEVKQYFNRNLCNFLLTNTCVQTDKQAGSLQRIVVSHDPGLNTEQSGTVTCESLDQELSSMSPLAPFLCQCFFGSSSVTEIVRVFDFMFGSRPYFMLDGNDEIRGINVSNCSYKDHNYFRLNDGTGVFKALGIRATQVNKGR